MKPEMRRCFYVLLFLQTPFSQYKAQPDSRKVFSLIDKTEEFFTKSNYDSALYYCSIAEDYSGQKT